MHTAFRVFYLIFGTVLLAGSLPLLLELLVLTTASLLPRRAVRRTRDCTGRPAALRRLGVIIPAHNEETLIERCLKSLMASMPKDVEIFVVAHNCDDATAKKAEQAGATVLIVDDPGQKGKASALREGFRRAFDLGAEACVVVDADSVVSTDFLPQMQIALTQDAGAVQAVYKVLPLPGSNPASLASIGFQGFNVVRPRGRERLGLSAGIFGNGFGLRREVLEKVPYDADSVVEDLEYHIQLVTAGERVHFLEDAFIFGEMPQGGAGSNTQRARWEGGRLLMIRRAPLKLLGAILSGRGRLLEPLMDVLSLPLALGAVFMLLLLPSPQEWMQIAGTCGLAIIGFHVLIALRAGPDFWKGVRVLARVPGYVFWKLMLLPKIVLASRPDAAWIRTNRDEPEFPGRHSADAIE